MVEASAASVRKEQSSKRSNRPRSPLKKPPRQELAESKQDGAYSPFDQGPSRQAPPKPEETTSHSAGTGTGIHPPYVRAAARRAQRLPTLESAESSYYYSSTPPPTQAQTFKPQDGRAS
eukprot:2032857-Amphidinium_carterae.2